MLGIYLGCGTDMFKISTKGIDNATKNCNKSGIVYVLDLDVDGKQVVKIGVTTRKIEDRVVEILTSHFHAYRVFPRCRPKRFKSTVDIFEKEKILLDYFSDRKYRSEKKFGGCEELVDVPLGEVVEAYDIVINGGSLDETRYDRNTKSVADEAKPKRGRGRPRKVREADGCCGVDVAREAVEEDANGAENVKE